jgi:hypothetical protein
MSESTIPAGSGVGGRDKTIKDLFSALEGADNFGQCAGLLRLGRQTVAARDTHPSEHNAIALDVFKLGFRFRRRSTRLLHNDVENGLVGLSVAAAAAEAPEHGIIGGGGKLDKA